MREQLDKKKTKALAFEKSAQLVEDVDDGSEVGRNGVHTNMFGVKFAVQLGTFALQLFSTG